ncbi:YitT family protein [Tepidibacillus marianensis]|uniref:YitT family protein n=1 Tax=Tepidibacillus marianensis TaxID=3131995 RepID=UPI0030CC2D86
MLMGAMLNAYGLSALIRPNGVSNGGFVGLSIIVNHFVPNLSIGTALLLFKIPAFLVGVYMLGIKTGLRTIVSMLAISAFIDVFAYFSIGLHPLVAAILGGLLMGGGASLMIKGGASTGGFSVIGQIINLKTGFPIGRAILFMNSVVLLLTALVFGIGTLLYTLVNLFMNSSTIDLLKTKQRAKGL